MVQPRVLIVRAPGTNCDQETAFAFEEVGARTSSVHINALIDDPNRGREFQILCFPGGFSFGDDIAAGRILAQRLNVHLQELVASFCNRDRLVLGICNGFQVMMRLGIFFPADHFHDALHAPPATLTLNQQSRFEDRWVHLRVDGDNCVFLRDMTTMYLPMAHAEGRMVFRDEASADKLGDSSQLALRYCDDEGNAAEDVLAFPTNPNGSQRNVAGLCDPSGRIFGLMPHPERHLVATHHPFWTRREIQPEHGDGYKLFENAVSYFA